jgi:hypothetical protein
LKKISDCKKANYIFGQQNNNIILQPVCNRQLNNNDVLFALR